MTMQAAPSAATPEAIAALWAKLLGHDEFDHDANFFDVGGHSLVANALVVEIEGHFGVRLPVVAVFDHPTINDLARKVNEAGRLSLQGGG
jgi:acyl carrier protein